MMVVPTLVFGLSCRSNVVDPEVGSCAPTTGDAASVGFYAHFEPVSHSENPDPASPGFTTHMGYEADLLTALEAMEEGRADAPEMLAVSTGNSSGSPMSAGSASRNGEPIPVCFSLGRLSGTSGESRQYTASIPPPAMSQPASNLQCGRSHHSFTVATLPDPESRD